MDSSYYVTSTADSLGIMGMLGALLAKAFLLPFLIMVFLIVSTWILFKKHGKPGWAAIVPIYNIIIFCEIADKEWWYLFLLMIPVANIYFAYVILDAIAKKHGKDGGFSVCLLLFPYVFIPVLAFEKDNLSEVSNNSVSTDNSFENSPVSMNINNQVNETVVMKEPSITSSDNEIVSETPVSNAAPTFDAPVNSEIQNTVPTFDTKAPSPAFTAPQSPVMPQQQAPVAGPIVNDAPIDQNFNSFDGTNNNVQ